MIFIERIEDSATIYLRSIKNSAMKDLGAEDVN